MATLLKWLVSYWSNWPVAP